MLVMCWGGPGELWTYGAGQGSYGLWGRSGKLWTMGQAREAVDLGTLHLGSRDLGIRGSGIWDLGSGAWGPRDLGIVAGRSWGAHRGGQETKPMSVWAP